MSDPHDNLIDRDLAEGFAQLHPPEELMSKLMLAAQTAPLDHAWGYGSEQRLQADPQECFGVFDLGATTLAIVCDGAGGPTVGAHAASLAVRTLHDAMRELASRPLGEALEESLKRTNVVIYQEARKNHRLMGMTTTAVVVAVRNGVAHVAHVGDSRAYRIHDRQVQQLTRDHTMVNLFVDAELLTPEDAATHPEANVLSRSLGAERQVEVDVGEPIPLEPSDVLFLCSDGVYGVMTDWELASVDWTAPHEGVRHLLDVVRTREGDDSATAVVISMTASVENVPATPVPDPTRLDDMPLSASLTAVPLDDDEDLLANNPSNRPTLDAGEPSFVAQEDAPVPDLPDARDLPPSEPQVAQGPQPAQRPAPIAELPPDTFSVEKTWRSVALRAVPIVLAGGMLAAAGLGAVLFLTSSNDEEMAATASENPSSVKVEQAAPVEPSDLGEPAVADAELEPEVQTLFRPEVPETPRRLPHRSTVYTQPPPGGQVQFEAVNHARNKECAKSLDAVQRGMDISIDYAQLYKQAWLCFADAHQRPLEQAHVEHWEDFRYVVPHFEGTPEDRQAALVEDEDLESLPEWYRPAVDGIEFRLERYADSTDEDKLVDVLDDLLGEPTVADQLAVDLYLVAQAAEGLSRVEDPSDEVTQWWARRVYVARRALNGRVGRVIQLHRREMIPVIRDLVSQATEPRRLASGGMSTVPEVVLLARDVGLGRVPPPVPVAAPVEPPTLNEGDIEDAGDPTIEGVGSGQ